MATITVVSFKNFRDNHARTMFSALIFVSGFLFLVEVGLFSTTGVLLCTQNGGAIKCHILAILLIIPLTGLGFGCCFKPKTQIFIYLFASMTCYHFCWIVIGVMMNALWGVSVFLLICVFIVVLVFIFSNFLQNLENDCIFAMLYLSLILPFLSLVTLVILNGQSFFEKDTTDSIVKTVILSVITAIMSWTVFPREGNGPANARQGNGPAYVREGNGSEQAQLRNTEGEAETPV